MTITDEELERIYEAWRTRPDCDLICYLPDLIAALREARLERDENTLHLRDMRVGRERDGKLWEKEKQRAEAAEAEVARLRELVSAVREALPLVPIHEGKFGAWRRLADALEALDAP